MKKAILITVVFALISAASYAQTSFRRAFEHMPKSARRLDTGFQITGTQFFVGSPTPPAMQITPGTAGKIITICINKRRITWLNDSTFIIKLHK